MAELEVGPDDCLVMGHGVEVAMVVLEAVRVLLKRIGSADLLRLVLVGAMKSRQTVVEGDLGDVMTMSEADVNTMSGRGQNYCSWQSRRLWWRM